MTLALVFALMAGQATFVPLTAEERYVADLRARIATGDVEAEVALGNLYEAGSVLPQDPAQAAIWYRRAADKGHAGAQMNLAMMYFDGEGVPRDIVQAIAWYEKAAEQRRSDRQLQPWLDLRIGCRSRRARRGQGGNVVSQGRRAGPGHRAISAGADVSRWPGSLARHGGKPSRGFGRPPMVVKRTRRSSSAFFSAPAMAR
jgi:hypothetical protein